MKKAFVYLLSIVFLFGLSQKSSAQKDLDTLFKDITMPLDEATKTIVYKKVVNCDGTKDELYRKAITWFNSYYKNPTGVLKEQNIPEGRIVGKHQIMLKNPPDKKGIETNRGIVCYTITTEFKDGRFRYELSDIYLKEASKFPIERWLDKTSQTYTPKFNYFLRQVDDYMKATISSLEKAMNAKEAQTPTDW
jgi:hypothetical protein